jgi:tetratricopeptide (TPR) repeat protein
MGLIGVTLGNTKEALPYFKKALDVNSDIEQHWISYILALIDLGSIKRARAALKKAQRKRINEDTLRELRQRLTRDSNTDQVMWGKIPKKFRSNLY